MYAPGVGRPAIDPEAAVRLMLAGFLLGIVHDRRLMREAQVNLAIRWFAGFGLGDRLPDHSSLTRIRQRWGAERFRHVFQRTARACVSAGIAKGEVVHVDASLIRADVSWESLAVRHVSSIAAANGDEAFEVDAPGVEACDAAVERQLRNSKKSGKFKKVCLTDPEATMATSGRNRRLEPSYKQHGVVDDERGVILDVEVTTGEINEGQAILERLDAVVATTGVPIGAVTADAGYAYAKVFAGLEAREITGVIPTKAEPIRSKVPLRRFRYDAKHDHVKCPRGKNPAPQQSQDQPWPVLCLEGPRLPRLRSGHPLPVPVARHQGPGDRPRLPGPAARPAPTRSLERGGQSTVPTSPLEIRGLSRRGEDLARAGKGRAPRSRQHAHSVLPHRRCDQPQAARRRLSGSAFRPHRCPTRANSRLNGNPATSGRDGPRTSSMRHGLNPIEGRDFFNSPTRHLCQVASNRGRFRAGAK